METHLKFKPGQQNIFIERIIVKSKQDINTLSAMVNISPRNFRDWKQEKISISKMAAEFLCRKFNIELPEKLEDMETRWKLNKSAMGKKGGLSYKKKYGNPGTAYGRQKGGFKTLAILRARGVIPQITAFNRPKPSSKLAEFVGIMLGDGSVGRLQVSITLNSIKDLDYSYYVTNLCKSLFGKEPKVRKRNNANALEIYYCGANLTKYLIKLGLIVGNKVKNQVGVPKWVFQKQKYQIMCLKGLMDTDGGVFIHKYRVGGKLYIYKKICFTNRSIPLLNFVYLTLKNVGLHPKITKEDKIVNKKVWLYNRQETRRYFDVVGSNNYRLLKFKESMPIG